MELFIFFYNIINYLLSHCTYSFELELTTPTNLTNEYILRSVRVNSYKLKKKYCKFKMFKMVYWVMILKDYFEEKNLEDFRRFLINKTFFLPHFFSYKKMFE
jgi:hypothetical protein